MERSQSFQGDFYPTVNRQLIEGDAVPAMGSIPRNVDGNNPRQNPRQPTANYPSGPSPFPTINNSHVYSFRGEENRDSTCPGLTPVHSHSQTTPSYQYNPQTELRNQWNGLARQEGLLPSAGLVSHSVASRNQGFPGAVIPPRAVGGHHFDHVPGHWFRVHEQAPGSSESIFALRGGFNGFTSSQDTLLPSTSNASTSGGGRHENQLQAVNKFVRPVPRPSHWNDPGLGPYSAANTTSTPEGFPWRDCHNPYTAAGSNRWQQHVDGIPASSGLSGGTTDGPEYDEPLYPNSPGREWIGEGRYLAAVPSNFHSDRVSGQPTRVQRSGKNSETKQGTGKDRVAPRRKRTPKRKPCDFPDSAKQFPGTSAVTHSSTRLIPVPQTRYNPTAKQDDWEEVAPIEFGSIKLTDAANRTWTGPHGYDSKVLNYNGVGTTISCRMSFSGREIGKLKIPTTNHKIPREPITKRKLASEVAKLVERCIKDIKDEPGCADITFENLVLVRLFRVSKASWQPELFYEAPAPRVGPRTSSMALVV